MKLGDNMTMEAYNVWGDVTPRKCRPPKIGDIPKHTAVDEESPGSSSKTIASNSRDSALEIPLDSTGSIVFPLESEPTPEEFLPFGKFEAKRRSPEAAKEFHRPAGRDAESRNFESENRGFLSLGKSIIEEEILPEQDAYLREPLTSDRLDYRRRKLTEPKSEVTIKLTSTEDSSSVSEKASSTELLDSRSFHPDPEDASDQDVLGVRKDSALFLEEPEGLPTLREILKSRALRIIRPRRESSGYASNLSTFDEDRRNSSSIDVLQDLSSFLKERRRSSTKRLNPRINVARTEESLTEEVANSAVDRMPTTEVYRNISSAGLEMPNIEEVKEVLRDESEPAGEKGLDDIRGNVAEALPPEDPSTRHRLLGEASNRGLSSRDDPRTDVIDTSKTCITAKLESPSKDVFETTRLNESINRISTRISSPPRDSLQRMVHQCSVPCTLNLSAQSSRRRFADELPHLNKVVDSNIQVCRHPQTSSGAFARLEGIERGPTQIEKEEVPSKIELNLPRSIKVYQLLSTQSEDRVDLEPQFSHRRISLQISKQDETVVPVLPVVSPSESNDISIRAPRNISTSRSTELCRTRCRADPTAEFADDSPVRKLSSPGEVGTTQRFLGDSPNVAVRPIYPYCPYSPYGSPQGSPRNRRRPLRESRRVSIDNRQGALQLNQYKLLDNIGQGSFGIVKLVYNEEDETRYAMKILSKKKLMKKAGIFGRMAPGRKGAANPLTKVYREIALLKKLDHPNVVKLVEVLDDPDEDNLYLVFELVQRGEVLQIPTDKPLDEETARKNFRDVVMGVEYLHYQRIVHRDIKPSNLLVDSDGRVKIADLGVSAELRASGELLSGSAGTPAFAAPETTTPGAHYSGTLCDVWSMGVTLYSLVTGRVPWDGSGSIIGVQAAVRTEPLRFPEKPLLSENLRELISRMLAKDPAERVTLMEIKEDTWLTNRGAEPLPNETDNCRLPVTVTDEEVERVVTRVPKLDTLILIKTMLKQHSFQNPFLSKKSGKATGSGSVVGSMELSSPGRQEETLAPRETIRHLKSERFQRAGRSNSAPDSYDWQTNDRQISVESPLPPVTEASSQECDVERR